jgi:hypothetical protein
LERYGLEVGSVIAGGPESNSLELSGDVLGREVPAAGAGAAPLERVRGEELEVGAKRGRLDGARDRIRGRALGRPGARERRRSDDERCSRPASNDAQRLPPGTGRKSEPDAHIGAAGASAAASAARVTTRTCWAMPSMLIHAASWSFG